MSKSRLIDILILFLVIFNSGGISVTRHFYITLVILLLVLIKAARLREYKWGAWAKLTSVPFAVLILNLAMTNKMSQLFDIYIIKEYLVYSSYLVIAAGVVVYYRSSKKDFSKDLFSTLRIFMYHGMANFVAVLLFSRHLDLYAYRDYVCHTIFGVFFYPLELVGYHVVRNQGLFWEPGVLQIYMNILLFLSLFVCRNKVTALLSGLVILSTISTTGVIVSCIILTTYIIKVAFREDRYILPLAVVAVMIFGVIAMDNIEEKFFGEYKRSAEIRMYDFMTGLNIIKENPVKGIGMSRAKYIDISGDGGYMDIILADHELFRGSTNSLVKMAASLGIPLFALYLIVMYRQKLVVKEKKLFFLILILVCSTHPVTVTIFFSLFIVSGLPSSEGRVEQLNLACQTYEED